MILLQCCCPRPLLIISLSFLISSLLSFPFLSTTWDSKPGQNNPSASCCLGHNVYPELSNIGESKNWHKIHTTLHSVHPNISMHILDTVLFTFPKVLTRRICLTIKNSFIWWSFPLFLWPYCVIQGWYWRKK